MKAIVDAGSCVGGVRVRRFRFGLVHTTADGLHWADHARRVESEGFSTLLVADHYGVARQQHGATGRVVSPAAWDHFGVSFASMMGPLFRQ